MRNGNLNKEIKETILKMSFMTVFFNVGIGKTATVKHFGKLLGKAGNRKRRQIKYIHINCRKYINSKKNNGIYSLLMRIAQSQSNSLPKSLRGYSRGDLLDFICHYGESNKFYIIVLDDIDYRLKIEEGRELFYSLLNIEEDSNKQISLIGILKDIHSTEYFDVDLFKHYPITHLRFKDYTPEQIFDILKYRAELGLKPDICLEHISQMVYNSKGDLRYGLNLICKATRIAQNNSMHSITPEYVEFLRNKEFSFREKLIAYI